MNILAFNASPRKKWNTATMLESVLDGARSKGAQCEMVHLYDLSYKGCISCFECKKICHNLDEGWVEEAGTQNSFCATCAKAKGIRSSAA